MCNPNAALTEGHLKRLARAVESIGFEKWPPLLHLDGPP